MMDDFLTRLLHFQPSLIALSCTTCCTWTVPH